MRTLRCGEAFATRARAHEQRIEDTMFPVIFVTVVTAGAVVFGAVMIVNQLQVLERLFNRHHDDEVRDNERLRHALLELGHSRK